MTITTTFDFNNPRSGIKYDSAKMEEALKNYINSSSNGYLSIGEVTHPDIDETIRLQYATHKVTNVENKDGIISVSAEMLDTPMGKVVKDVLSASPNAEIKFVPRMTAYTAEEVDENGNKTGKLIREIDKITTWDMEIQK